jgi:3-hydroxyacyl-CoA dehydrogenase/enoyl-CoA hydratase/3-hydroxybutyryl-CoA epimerase
VALDYVRAIRRRHRRQRRPRLLRQRCVGAYILEGHLMLMEGVPPAMIENAGKQAGMPVGPLS